MSKSTHDIFDEALKKQQTESKSTDSTHDIFDKALAQKASEQIPEPGYLESFLRGGAQTATFGLADELASAIQHPTGAAKAIANIVGAHLSGKDLEEYQKTRDESRAAYKAAEEANPMTSLAGSLIGGLIPSTALTLATGGAAPAAAAAAGAAGEAAAIPAATEAASAVSEAANIAKPLSSVQKAMLIGGAEGGAYGAGQSEEESLGGIAKDVATGGALGAATGGVFGKLGRYLGGNEAEIASGALPGAAPDKGQFKKLMDSKLGELYKGAYQSAQKSIDTTSTAADKLRELERGVLGTEVAKETQKSTSKIGKLIGEKVEEAGKFKVPEFESVMEQLPKNIQEEQLKTIPAKYGKVSNAPESLLKSLQENQEKLTKLINEDPGVVTDIFRKRTGAVLPNELPYASGEKEVAGQIRKQLAENPDQLIEDLTKAVTTGETSQDLQSLQENIKIKSQLGKLTKAAIEEKPVSENTIAAKDLLDKIQATKKEIIAAGTREFIETPEQTVKTLVDKIDTSHILPHDVPEASRLKAIIAKFVNPDGTVDPEKTAILRDKLNKFIPKMENDDLQEIAKKLEEQISSFRREASGEELYRKFSTAKSQMEQLGLDKSSKKYDLEKIIGPEFAKKLETSQTPAKKGAAELEQVIKELQDLHQNPKIDEAVKKMKESALYSRIYALKSGSSGSMLPDMAKRLAVLLPAELAGEFSTTGVAKSSLAASKTLYNLPSKSIKAIASRVESLSPQTSKLLNNLADTTDEGKKRAILNMLNQMPQFRKAIGSMVGVEEE